MTDNHSNQTSLPEDANRLLRETEAADFLGYSVRALQNWRLRGGGPLFVRVSSRSIRYRFCDLLEWTEDRLVASTSDRLDPAPTIEANSEGQVEARRRRGFLRRSQKD